ncbi:MAG: hypothetical protein ACRC4O_03450 [Giesbergeria sp.]
MAIELDNVARSYSLASLTLGTFLPDEANTRQNRVDVYLETEGTNCWFSLSKGAQAIDETSRVAAGGTLAFSDNMCGNIPSGEARKVTLQRAEDVFLNVKGGGAGTLRLWVASVAI